MVKKCTICRIATVPLSLDKLLGEQLRFINQHFDVTAVSANQEELEAVAKKYGVDYFHVEMTRKITPLVDVLAIWKLYRFLKREKPAMIHSHTPKAGLVGMLAAKLAGVPVRLHTVAGLPLMESSGVKRMVLNWVEKLTYAAATKVYPNSKGLYDFILENKFTKAEKLKVLGKGSSNGINTSHFSLEQMVPSELQNLRNKLNIQETDFVFIFVGRLVGDKGINELVNAFKQIGKSVHQQAVKLLLVGPLESDLDPLLPETLHEIEKNPNIITVGFQKDVRPYFAISNALAFPSYREGFPNVVMQAGAMELPSVVTDINGCNEIIIEGENGLIVPTKNAYALHETMRRIVEDPMLYVQLKKNARRLISERYEQRVVWEAILNEYNSLLNDKGLK